MTLITLGDWSVFLTTAIACNQDGPRIAEECESTDEVHRSCLLMAANPDVIADETVNNAMVECFRHYVLVHDLRPTRGDLFPLTTGLDSVRVWNRCMGHIDKVLSGR